MQLITTDPATRNNDRFVRSRRIDASAVRHDVSHDLIPPTQATELVEYWTDFHRHVALDVVTETRFQYPYPGISEKTLRPMACKRMFVLIAPANSLALLRSMGFQTWAPLIDETYDGIVDPEERFLAAINAINVFCAMELDHIKTWMQQQSWRFDHNLSRLQQLRQSEIQRIARDLGIHLGD